MTGKPSRNRCGGTCLGIVVGIVIACMFVSLAVAVWSAVEVRKLSSNASFPESLMLSTPGVNNTSSIQSQLSTCLIAFLWTVSSHSSFFLLSNLFSQLPSPSGYYWVRASVTHFSLCVVAIYMRLLLNNEKKKCCQPTSWKAHYTAILVDGGLLE